MQRQVSVDAAVCENVDFGELVTVLEDVLTLLEEFLVQFVDESLKGICAKLLEVYDVQELVLEPLLVLVLVLHEIVVELLLDIWEDVQQFVEVVLRDHANGGVVARLYCSSALGAGEQRDLTEVLPRVECAHEALLAILVLDIALAFALCDDVKVVGGLALLNLDFLWLAHDQLDLRDDIVLDFGVEREDQILLQLL